MEKLILVLWLTTIFLLIFISLLLNKIVKKLYKKEIKAKIKKEEELLEKILREKERRQTCYNLNFLERVIFHINFIPGFILERVVITEDVD